MNDEYLPHFFWRSGRVGVRCFGWVLRFSRFCEYATIVFLFTSFCLYDDSGQEIQGLNFAVVVDICRKYIRKGLGMLGVDFHPLDPTLLSSSYHAAFVSWGRFLFMAGPKCTSDDGYYRRRPGSLDNLCAYVVELGENLWSGCGCGRDAYDVERSCCNRYVDRQM